MSLERQLFIDGSWRKTAKFQTVISPFDGHEVARVALAGPEDLEAATQASIRAFGEMRSWSRRQRADLLRRIAEGVARRKEAIAATMTDEMGKPIRFAHAEVERCVTTFTLAAEEATRWTGELIPVDIEPHTKGYFAMTVLSPLGPIAGISPFNFPLNLVAHKIAPCLAVGSSMVLKPARQTPLEALTLAEVIHEAGAPAGAFNVVNCEPSVGERLATDERFPYLTFTGSAVVGWSLKEKAWKKRRVTLELGGNAACIVHSDADLDYAVTKSATAGFGQAGQSCISVQRLLVHDSIFETFREKLLDAVAKLPVGDPKDPKTIVGPVIDAGSADRILSWISEAKKRGARVLTGGTREGNVVQPTVIVDADPDMKVSCQEIFGPVVTLTRYKEFEMAVRIAGDSRFGLQAGIFTHDIRLIRHAVSNLDVGGVMVNEVPSMRVDNMPYGGSRDSGIGREGPLHAMHEMSEPRLVMFNLDH